MRTTAVLQKMKADWMDDSFRFQALKNTKTIVGSPNDVHELVEAACSEGLLELEAFKVDMLACWINLACCDSNNVGQQKTVCTSFKHADLDPKKTIYSYQRNHTKQEEHTCAFRRDFRRVVPNWSKKYLFRKTEDSSSELVVGMLTR